MTKPGSHCKILLTGPPGIGKTTIVKNVCDQLKMRKHITLTGFYTQEVREGGQRKGFDVITLDGNSTVLARRSYSMGQARHSPSVGQYSVDIKSFESMALPTIENKTDCIICIDEIGKMELFSRRFSSAVRRIFNEARLPILATIPISKGKALPVVEEICSREDVEIMTVSKSNREELVTKVIEKILAAL